MRRRRHLIMFDIMRIIFCLAVFLYHIGALRGGYLAVNGFFVISAYLSVRSFLGHHSARDYYIRRFRRIYLPLLAVVFLTAAFFSLFPEIHWFTVKKETLSVLLSFNNYYQISASQDYFARASSTPFLHLWYISLLVQYELLLPPLCLLMRKISGKISKALPFLLLGVTIIVSFTVFASEIGHGAISLAYYGSFSRCYAVLSGMLIGYVETYYPTHTAGNRGLRKLFIFILLLMMVVMFFAVPPSSAYFTAAMGTMTLLIAVFIFPASHDEERPLKAGRMIRGFSDLAYEFYLVHYPVIFFLENTQLPLFLRIPLILFVSFFLSLLLKHAFSFRKGKRALSVVLCALIVFISAFGVINVIKAEDHSEEMKELEERLEENRKLIEERNRAYAGEVKAEEEAWERLLDSGTSDEEAVKELLMELPVIGVGDSIMLDAVRPLYEVFPNGYFDCEISLSLYYGEKVLSSLKEEGKLSSPVVLSLGTNGDYSQKRCEELIDIVEDREVFWINSVGADDPTYNAKFAAFTQEYPNIHIIHWEDISRGHPEYFYYDGIHVVGDGVRAYTEAIYDAVFERYLEIYRARKEEAVNEKENAARERIAFFGNDALTSSYEYIGELSKKAVFHTDPDYSFSTLYSQIEELLEEGRLEGKIVFVFDKKASLSKRDYEKLAELLHDREIMIFTINDHVDIEKENVRLIDLSGDLDADPDLLSSDKRHLSDKGSEFLGRTIHDSIENSG